MYLLDTNIVSEFRKAKKANRGVVEFMANTSALGKPCYLSAITIGELHMGAEKIMHRGDTKQANKLKKSLNEIADEYEDLILPVDVEIALIWAALRVPYYENAIDKLIAATALSHSLTLVTRNVKDFERVGVPVLNPFN